MADVLTTSKITLPTEVAAGILKKASDTSVIQALSPSAPQLFRNVEHVIFTKEPEAEFVGEGAQKSSSEVGFSSVAGKIHKAQVTVRMSEEVQWADEDNQLQVISAITEAAGAALGRALDYGVIHGINPLTGTAGDDLTPTIVELATKVSTSGSGLDDLDALVDDLNESWDINGLAMSKAFANSLRKERNELGTRLFPDIPINLQVGSVEGIPAAVSNTVSGALASEETDVLAIMGDFSAVKWGIVRDLGVEVITMGDPDGQGDLKRMNQIAYRLEMVYSWAIMHTDEDEAPFAVLKSA